MEPPNRRVKDSELISKLKLRASPQLFKALLCAFAPLREFILWTFRNLTQRRWRRKGREPVVSQRAPNILFGSESRFPKSGNADACAWAAKVEKSGKRPGNRSFWDGMSFA
jgi:hypothetical protein